jgi:uncharacterized membrane protein
MKQAKTARVAGKKAGFDAHHRFILACVLAALTFAGLHGHAAPATQLVISWNVFAAATVVLAWMVMLTEDPYEMRRNASLQDASRTFLFVVVVSAATVSLFAVFILLGSSKNLAPGRFAEHVTLSVAAIALSWLLVHTLFSLRYAHLYFVGADSQVRDKIKGGLVFPDDGIPDYLDFAYFSFVIGMTCQVSDVQISSKRLRRLAMIHGLIAFAFNTAILALFVNIIAGLV